MVLQKKGPHHSQAAKPSRPVPVAPPVYRPQPTPKVLQRKVACVHTSPAKQSVQPAKAPPVYRPTANRITQPKVSPAGRDVVQRSCFSGLWESCFGKKSSGEEQELIPRASEERPSRSITRAVEVGQGDFREMKKGEIATSTLTTCTMVYVRSNAGRVVIYHWPFTIVSDKYQPKMTKALEAINATEDVALIKLFSKENTAELNEYLRRYTRNIETITLTRHQEPIITFEGNQMGM